MAELAGVGCVVMASGEGKRFGGNKLMAPVGGAPMFTCALSRMADCFDALAVVTRHEDVAQVCRERGWPVILHDLPLRSDTVRLGIGQMPDTVTHCLFLQGDQPFFSRRSALKMIAQARLRPELILRAAWQGEGASPVLFPRWAFPELAALPPGKGGGALIRRYPDRVAAVEVDSPAELLDIDTRDLLPPEAPGEGAAAP